MLSECLIPSDITPPRKLIPGEPWGGEDVVEGILKRRPPIFWVAHSLPQFIEDLVIRPTPSNLNGLLPGHHHAVTFPEVGHVVHLQPCGRGQNDVCLSGAGGEEEIRDHEEVDLLQGGLNLPGVGPRYHGIGA